MQLVSIIVPIYNTEKYLAECLDSLINQTYKNLEIICVNDGSTDNSLKILEQYAKRDNRIKIYSQENKGEAETRNRGLELAQGDYIAAIDSDDSCSLDFIELCVKKVREANSDIIIPFTNIRLDMNIRDVKTFSYFGATQIFVTKKLILDNPDIRYNPKIKMGPDAIFAHKLLTTTEKIDKETESKYFYRQHENQISTNMSKHVEKYMQNIDLWFEDIIDFYNKKQLWEKYNNHFLNFLCEQPFTVYLRQKLDSQQKTSLFNKIHKVIKDNNISIAFDYSNNRVKMFKKFLSCKTYKEFEFYWWLSHIYIKFIEYKKSKFNKYRGTK